MATTKGERTYMGMEIKGTSRAEALYPWYVQTHHSPTGIQWAEEHCPQFWSLEAAREWIREKREEEKAVAMSSCGCRVEESCRRSEGPRIVYCPMHQAAPDLLAAL